MKMLTVVLLLVAASLTVQVGLPTGNRGAEDLHNTAAKVEGRVVNSVNGMPVPNVTLTLRSVSSPRPLKYVVTSDVGGGFLFDLVEPRRYELSGQKVGFLRESYGAERVGGNGTPLTVPGGQHMKGLVFKLTPQGVISGRVTDESGEPMERVSVGALRSKYWQNGKRVLQSVGGALTNDLGEYRIANLGPGSYHVMAHRGGGPPGLRVAHADVPSKLVPQTPEEGYLDTFYPGSLDPEGSMGIQVQAGAETSGVDITFQKTRVFRVRGEVVDASGQPVREASIALTNSKTGGMLHMTSLGGPPVANGKFEVTGVIPGTYDLVAQVTRNSQTLYARQPVSVADRNITDIVIRIPESVDVAGRVKVTGLDSENPRSASFRMEGIGIVLFPAEGFSLGPIPKPTNPQADGSFVLRQVVPDKVRIHISGIPPGWYAKSILTSGRERADGIVDLTSGGTVEIVLAVGAVEVTGSVVDADDKPTSGVTVSLVPKDGSRKMGTDLFRTAIADERGHFLLKDVAPGTYEVFAWQEAPEAINDAEFRQLFESKSTSLRVNESGREIVQLKVISAEDVAKATGSPR